ncbi:MAG: hypothetical protein R2878_01995 [Thermoleophilia bacterium]
MAIQRSVALASDVARNHRPARYRACLASRLVCTVPAGSHSTPMIQAATQRDTSVR